MISQIFTKINNEKFLEKLNFNRYAIMALGMTGQSCFASLAGYEILKLVPSEENVYLLCILIPICMVSNAIALAQASIKLYVYSLILSVVTSLSLLIYVYSLYL